MEKKKDLYGIKLPILDYIYENEKQQHGVTISFLAMWHKHNFSEATQLSFLLG